MEQQRLFDQRAGAAARDAGMKQAADRKNSLLEYARGIAYRLALKNGTVTADCVAKSLVRSGITEDQFGCWMGSLFRGRDFVFTGEFRQSDRVSNHGRYNRVWGLK